MPEPGAVFSGKTGVLAKGAAPPQCCATCKFLDWWSTPWRRCALGLRATVRKPWLCGWECERWVPKPWPWVPITCGEEWALINVPRYADHPRAREILSLLNRGR